MEWSTIERSTQGPVPGLLVPFEVAMRKVLDAQQFLVDAEALRRRLHCWLKEVGNTEDTHRGSLCAGLYGLRGLEDRLLEMA